MRIKRTIFCSFSLAVFLTSATFSQAQSGFSLPIEFGQGIIFKPGVDPYTFSAQLHPSLGFGDKFTIGGSMAGVYTNPDWAFMWGGRLAFHLAKLSKKPIGAGPGIDYGTLHFVGTVLLENGKLRRTAGGLILDIWDGTLQISPRAGYDDRLERPFLEVTLGTNLFAK
ncbi:hypothetical protein L0337_07145 [candidate division KSB1 bacterium]|nr:hypothetical protein [candidate division KSB1 bacterium]